MDHNITSLSLALENHELNVGDGGLPSPRIVGGTSLNSDSHYDIGVGHGNWHARNSSGTFPDELEYDDCDSTQELSYETSQKLFVHISNKDLSVRGVALDKLAKSIMIWVKNAPGKDGKGMSETTSPVNMTMIDNLASNSSCVTHTATSSHKTVTNDGSTVLIKHVLVTLLRLSCRCPFLDVRHKCMEILSKLEAYNMPLPLLIRREVSHFIPIDQIHTVDTDDEQTYALYTECFVQNCRLEHMIMVMAMHPQYLQHFLETNFTLLRSKGVLSYDYRNYIAIMAAARHQSAYLVHLMESQFILEGGNIEWLRGLDFVPGKLRALSTLNKLLAHRPWLVTPGHIKDLMEGDAACRWQHPELAQALVLLCHFHSVAIFCLGTSINLEIDHERAHTFNFLQSNKSLSENLLPLNGRNSPTSADGSLQIGDHTDDVEELMERMKKLREDEEEVTREEMNRWFEKEKQEASHGLIPKGVFDSIGDTLYFSRYVIDPNFRYQDFAKRDAAAEIPTFRAQDYNWDDHAFLMISNYYRDVADLLDEKFKIAYNLTYKTLASKDNVDTTSLRRAIWKYVHCMYGIMYDDYNYGEVNQLLERPLKVFIKTVSCFPEQSNQAVYEGFWKQFRHSEKVHVNIMLLESRLQVGLLYGMRALTQYMRDC